MPNSSPSKLGPPVLCIAGLELSASANLIPFKLKARITGYHRQYHMPAPNKQVLNMALQQSCCVTNTLSLAGNQQLHAASQNVPRNGSVPQSDPFHGSGRGCSGLTVAVVVVGTPSQSARGLKACSLQATLLLLWDYEHLPVMTPSSSPCPPRGLCAAPGLPRPAPGAYLPTASPSGG